EPAARAAPVRERRAGQADGAGARCGPMQTEDPTLFTITELGAAFRARRLSPVEATQLCLDRIARLDPTLHAFITVTGELALEQARAAAAELERGHDRGPLHGVPIALKDLVDMAGV